MAPSGKGISCAVSKDIARTSLSAAYKDITLSREVSSPCRDQYWPDTLFSSTGRTRMAHLAEDVCFKVLAWVGPLVLLALGSLLLLAPLLRDNRRLLRHREGVAQVLPHV